MSGNRVALGQKVATQAVGDLAGVDLVVLLFRQGYGSTNQPQAIVPAGNAVQMVSQDPATQNSIYRLDAAALPAEKRTARPTPELERETHDVLSRTVDDLKGRTFQVRRIDPAFAGDGSVLYCDITIHP